MDKQITLKEAQQIDGIDLTLDSLRTQVTLILDLRYEDGSVVTATGIPKISHENEPPITSIGANINDVNGIGGCSRAPIS
jgi:hypothetical protein